MFHAGDLQSGISVAIAEQKLVGCFIKQTSDQCSDEWENDFFARLVGPNDTPVLELLATKAVLLKLEHLSQEANFLNAFCPITSAPMFVLIRNGIVVEQLKGPMSEDEWFQRVSKATGLDLSSASGKQSIEQQKSSEEVQADNMVETSTPEREPTQTTTDTPVTASDPRDTAPAPQTSSSSAAPNPTPSTSMSDLFPNRAQQHEEEKKRREEAEKAERIARANARRKEAEEAYAAHNKSQNSESAAKDKARHDWVYQQKQRKDEAKRERERILAQIEADKVERRARNQLAKEELQGASSPMRESNMAAMNRKMGAGGRCDLSVRLFDGSSIKGRFEPAATLGGTVRDWIKEETGDSYRADKPPYTFREILAPQPSRSIEILQEGQSLAELGMVPTATLVLVPVSGYSDAYPSAGGFGGSGFFGRIYGFFIWLWSVLASFVAFGPSARPPGVSEEQLQQGGKSTDVDLPDMSKIHRGPRMQMKTLADQRAEAAKRDDQKAEFYNGNSLGFESRKDDDDEDGKKQA